jgi:hypothetical protein
VSRAPASDGGFGSYDGSSLQWSDTALLETLVLEVVLH